MATGYGADRLESAVQVQWFNKVTNLLLIAWRMLLIILMMADHSCSANSVGSDPRNRGPQQ
ncbi:hypothetical protein MANES_08G001200v8 [Manihot esculenta]|uniref:Uncharacterized protein n=3 Tax=Manihot esculenta TaxID=3983 RepID=A0ACB7H883_MANES|nr:hypothetical protein MANES_08G001200v8 [Manihot esculenta]KAG8648448.1 hypothetical protein MANES_08G001200v8 [Manihot esculenta]KAG8648450.1 hypothetical protein MANES_08G001200v8 [Manihot esculenta]